MLRPSRKLGWIAIPVPRGWARLLDVRMGAVCLGLRWSGGRPWQLAAGRAGEGLVLQHAVE